MNHEYEQTEIAEWSDTFTCKNCGVSYTYAAEDCMSADRLSAIDTSECVKEHMSDFKPTELRDTSQEVQELRAQLKEAQAEIERLTEVSPTDEKFIALGDKVVELEIQLAAKDAEIERLRRNDFSTERLQNDCFKLALKVKEEQLAASQEQLSQAQAHATELESKLAASQANEVQLREALENHSGNYKLSKDECKYINSLLDAHPDTTALEAMIQKAGEVMRERCANHTEDKYDFCGNEIVVADTIRALPGVTVGDLTGSAQSADVFQAIASVKGE